MSKKWREEHQQAKTGEADVEALPSKEGTNKKSATLFFLKDIAIAVVIVIIVISSLFAYSGRWPPLVVIESGSMSHGEEAIPESQVGVIDAGDLVIIREVNEREDIITYVEGEKSGYERYGEYGDVILYHKNGYDDTPIIHRAILWIEFNDNSYDKQTKTGWAFDIPSLKLYNETGNISIDDVGYDGMGIAIDLYDIFHIFINNHEDPHSGFITLGDHNHQSFDQNAAYRNGASVGGLQDMQGNPVEIVKMDWVLGVARGEIPWFGAIKLYDTPSKNNIPDNSWKNLKTSIALIIAVPILVDVFIHIYDMRKKNMYSIKRVEMKNRNPIIIILLSCCTGGIYTLYWLVKTKEEINSMDGGIPTAWLLIIPIVGIYWLYKYCDAFGKVVKRDDKGMMLFIILIIFFPVALFMIQSELNKHANC